jgi:hypothetical protein
MLLLLTIKWHDLLQKKFENCFFGLDTEPEPLLVKVGTGTVLNSDGSVPSATLQKSNNQKIDFGDHSCLTCVDRIRT